jgi:hypothetical protein
MVALVDGCGGECYWLFVAFFESKRRKEKERKRKTS